MRGARILLIEDDQRTREALTHVLADSGAEVRTAANPAEAVRLALSWSPDVLMTDLLLPASDGVTLLRQVRAARAEQGLPSVPAIAVTGMAQSFVRSAALDGGFQDCIFTPIEGDALIATVLRRISPLSHRRNEGSQADM